MSHRFFFQKFVQRDKPDAVILDVDVLGALAVDFRRGIHIDCLYEGSLTPTAKPFLLTKSARIAA